MLPIEIFFFVHCLLLACIDLKPDFCLILILSIFCNIDFNCLKFGVGSLLCTAFLCVNLLIKLGSVINQSMLIELYCNARTCMLKLKALY